jgi:hypothetical protein
MGIYDRSYMKDSKAGIKPASSKRGRPKKAHSTVPLWNRIRFRIWLFFHPRRQAERRDR